MCSGLGAQEVILAVIQMVMVPQCLFPHAYNYALLISIYIIYIVNCFEVTHVITNAMIINVRADGDIHNSGISCLKNAQNAFPWTDRRAMALCSKVVSFLQDKS